MLYKIEKKNVYTNLKNIVHVKICVWIWNRFHLIHWFFSSFFLESSSKSFKAIISLIYRLRFKKNVNMYLLFDSFFFCFQWKKFFALFLHYVTLVFSKLSSDLLRRRIISEKFPTLFLRNSHRNFSNFLLCFDTDATRRNKKGSTTKVFNFVFCHITFDT